MVNVATDIDACWHILGGLVLFAMPISVHLAPAATIVGGYASALRYSPPVQRPENLGDMTRGEPHALHGLHGHRLDHRVYLALGSLHQGLEHVAAWNETSRLDPPGNGMR